MTQKTYTKEELVKKPRLDLRKICRGYGMSSDECLGIKFDAMVAYVLKQQGSEPEEEEQAGEPEEAPKETTKKAETTKKKRGRKPAARRAAPKEETEEAAEEAPETGEVSSPEVLASILKEVQGLRKENEELKDRMDTIGQILDSVSTKVGELQEDNGELRADTYKNLELAQHFYKWCLEDGVLTEDQAPGGVDFDTMAEQIDQDCAGNEDGDE